MKRGMIIICAEMIVSAVLMLTRMSCLCLQKTQSQDNHDVLFFHEGSQEIIHSAGSTEPTLPQTRLAVFVEKKCCFMCGEGPDYFFFIFFLWGNNYPYSL